MSLCDDCKTLEEDGEGVPPHPQLHEPRKHGTYWVGESTGIHFITWTCRRCRSQAMQSRPDETHRLTNWTVTDFNDLESAR